jgi:hypothetical protein
VTDWVQAGRYAAALDPVTIAGGPNEPVAPASSVGAGAGGGSVRQLLMSANEITAGLTLSLPVTLQAQGDENALGFTLIFDPSKFQFVGVSPGDAANSATLVINTKLTGTGQVGVLLALPPDTTFAAGVREVIQLTLRPNPNAEGSCSVTFGDQPVALAVSDPAADELAADYVAGSVLVNPLPALEVVILDDTVLLSWPLSTPGFQLHSSPSLTPVDWTPVSATVQTRGDRHVVTLPLDEETAYFRLHHP